MIYVYNFEQGDPRVKDILPVSMTQDAEYCFTPFILSLLDGQNFLHLHSNG